MKAPLIFTSSSHSVGITKLFKIVLSKVFQLKVRGHPRETASHNTSDSATDESAVAVRRAHCEAGIGVMPPIPYQDNSALLVSRERTLTRKQGGDTPTRTAHLGVGLLQLPLTWSVTLADHTRSQCNVEELHEIGEPICEYGEQVTPPRLPLLFWRPHSAW